LRCALLGLDLGAAAELVLDELVPGLVQGLRLARRDDFGAFEDVVADVGADDVRPAGVPMPAELAPLLPALLDLAICLLHGGPFEVGADEVLNGFVPPLVALVLLRAPRRWCLSGGRRFGQVGRRRASGSARGWVGRAPSGRRPRPRRGARHAPLASRHVGPGVKAAIEIRARSRFAPIVLFSLGGPRGAAGHRPQPGPGDPVPAHRYRYRYRWDNLAWLE
jgi:hypothetical protein